MLNALDAKNKEIAHLKQKNEQLKEKELKAYLCLEQQRDQEQSYRQAGAESYDWRNEVSKLSKANQDYAIQVYELQVKLQEYEGDSEGKSRKELEQENKTLRNTMEHFMR